MGDEGGQPPLYVFNTHLSLASVLISIRYTLTGVEFSVYLGSVTLDRWIRLLGANGPLGLKVGILLESI